VNVSLDPEGWFNSRSASSGSSSSSSSSISSRSSPAWRTLQLIKNTEKKLITYKVAEEVEKVDKVVEYARLFTFLAGGPLK
jgi:hypothetical protein